ADELLNERGIIRAEDDDLSVDPAAPLDDGETIAYRAAVPVTLTVDGRTRTIRTAAATVAGLLAAQHVAWDRHDAVAPDPRSGIASDAAVEVRHVQRWTETARRMLAPPIVHRWALALPAGKTRVIFPGRPGLIERRYAVVRMPSRHAVGRSLIASRVIRPARARIVAEGIGEAAALTAVARHSIAGTLKYASISLGMVATAYTAVSAGGSGRTALGMRAGQGVVAVDPAVIPLGTKMYIPGYGPAVAGDTGGDIRGRRIDLGFDSYSEATRFGRRSITVYLFR
ncbi:MAG: DUF348 domain-containing protein, partial [Candidatus Eremiobacteraeota bacterium]|nr:DUF348 domain-containing protein [Candidatus Eremiobacteraeota bacterium]